MQDQQLRLNQPCKVDLLNKQTTFITLWLPWRAKQLAKLWQRQNVVSVVVF